jgi:hypothetical protein
MSHIATYGRSIYDPSMWVYGNARYAMFSVVAEGDEVVVGWLAEKWDKWRHLSTRPAPTAAKDVLLHWLKARKLFTDDAMSLNLRLFNQATNGKKNKHPKTSQWWHMDRSSLLVSAEEFYAARLHVLEACARRPAAVTSPVCRAKQKPEVRASMR